MNKHCYLSMGLLTRFVRPLLCLFYTFLSNKNSRLRLHLIVASIAAVLLVSCGGGGGGSNQSSSAVSSASVITPGSSSSAPSTSTPPGSDLVLLKGSVTYERAQPIIVSAFTASLDYSNTITQPARSIAVQLLDDRDQVIAQTITDREGGYTFNAPSNALVKVRALAQLAAFDSSYSLIVKDNTSNNAPYALDGRLVSTGSASEQIRELHAPLGWDSAASAYTSPRASAPFAIADTLLKGIDLIRESDSSSVFPDLEVFWSVNNIAAGGSLSGGSLSSGDIGTSFYLSGRRQMYILGHADNDTDEFDSSILLHEFGHYIEDTLSRSDNIGGSHGLSRPSDLRVSFGEGFGNAFAAMSSGSRFYIDTLGNGQQRGFNFNVESNNFPKGAFMEGAVHSVLFDLVDDASEENDGVALGFSALGSVLSSDRYRNFEVFVSIYLLADLLKQQQPAQSAAIDALLQRESITSLDAFGGGEVFDLGLSYVLPVHHRISSGETIEVCSDNQIPGFSDAQEFNGFEVNRFVLLDIPARGRYEINATRSRGRATSDPDMQLNYRGNLIAFAGGSTNNTERLELAFERDVYVVAIHDVLNADDNSNTGGLVCFNVTLNPS